MKNQAIELTTFRLNNSTIEQFITANADIDTFLKRQKGFVSRSIFELKKILFMIYWYGKRLKMVQLPCVS